MKVQEELPISQKSVYCEMTKKVFNQKVKTRFQWKPKSGSQLMM